MSCPLFVPQKLTWGPTLRHFVPKGRLRCRNQYDILKTSHRQIGISGGKVLEDNRRIQQDNLLESVLEVLNILKKRRPDLNINIAQLTEVQALLSKDNLSSDDLARIDKMIGYLCHFKCLYDICLLEPLEGETEQECWQRWGQILDRMKSRANLLCSIKAKNRHKRLRE